MRAEPSWKVLVIASLLTLTAGVVLAGVKIQVDHDPSFDFGTLHTWTWNPKGAGSAAKIITQDDDSAAFKAQVEPKLIPIVTDELEKRGFPQARAGEPDFYVTYYVLITVGSTEQYLGQFANLPKWGLPPVAPATQSLKVYPNGSLILDVTSRATNEVVWRGVAQAEVKWSEDPNKRAERVRDAVRQLLKKFPPKSTKKT
jgi:hypothetical protein